MVNQRSVWHEALQDIRDARPRAHQPDMASLSPEDLKERAIFEAKLEQKLSSTYVPRHIWTIDTTSLMISVHFVPNSGGRFITCSKMGEVVLYSAAGQIMDSLDGHDFGEYALQLWICPVSPTNCLAIQLHQHGPSTFVT
jgi:hypothetical protein